MESGGKLELVLLSICLQIFTCDCSYVTYQHRNLNSWEILIGANEKEFVYDFCRYDASNNKERCHNHGEDTLDIRKKCNCTLNNTANGEDGFAYFTVNCNNETLDDLVGACPQKLTITYEQDYMHQPVLNAEEADETSIWKLLFFLSLLINVVCGVSLFMRRNYESIAVRRE
ncbi:uncharacterized protein LOC135937039 isoform X3 [Cloeon dipterum]|uniref:uncharacterized protein LOC135937039 isoform X3 n=1 Tax=Cloeon dipterum TaxID=197152 RepID=UPI00322082AC